MQVVEYLKEYGIGKLVSEFGIKVKEYPEGLLVLNYDQIESPKAHPIVMECRSLILDTEFNVVSRSFDRFFNYGEQPQTQENIDWSKAICFEKVDGSLIKIYHWNGKWHISTRGTAFGESTVNGFDVTFAALVMRALDVGPRRFQAVCDVQFEKDYTYIFEVTSTENRVVKAYSGYTLHYLGARNNKTYEYADGFFSISAVQFGARLPDMYSFGTPEECIETAKHLKDLDEGYVLWCGRRPVCKIKSPSYVAVHHIRGEGLNPKRISQIVLTGETDEYLKYFPEDAPHFEPYTAAKSKLRAQMQLVWDAYKFSESQKEFAIAIKEYPFSSVLFQARKQYEPHEPISMDKVFNEAREDYKIKLLADFLEVGV